MKVIGLILLLAALPVWADDKPATDEAPVADEASAADEMPMEKREPQMRAVDRADSYFAQLPCDRVEREPVHSVAEQRLLDRRKQQCLNRYKAFIPGGGVK